MKLEFSRQILEKCLNIKFHKQNPSSVARVVPCGQTEDGRTDMRHLIVVFAILRTRRKINCIPQK